MYLLHLDLYQTDILPLFFQHSETNTGESHLGDSQSFWTITEKLVFEVPSAAPQ